MSDADPPPEPASTPMLIWILLGGALILGFCMLLFLLHPPRAGTAPALPQIVPGKPTLAHRPDAKPMSSQ